MGPGDGVHVPVTAPHWVKNGPEVSVSFSITFQTRASERRGIVYRVNHALRQRGLKPPPVGQVGLARRDEVLRLPRAAPPAPRHRQEGVRP